MKIGLALSGGAVKGMAHIGVIKYLEERKINVSHVAGTSAGSLIGAFYAAGLSAEEMEQIALEINWKEIIRNITRVRFPRKGLINTEFLSRIVEKFLGQITFEDLEKPFIAVSVDIEKSNIVHTEQGDLTSALMASCAIPGILTPVERNGLSLVDGGVLQNIPTRPLVDKGLKEIIAVDLNAHSDLTGVPESIFEIIFRSIYMMARERDDQDSKLAKHYIAPDLGKIGAWELDKTKELIELGYQEAKNVLGQAQFKPGLWGRIAGRRK